MKLEAALFFRPSQVVKVEPRTPQSRFPLHDHDFDEIAVVISGHGWHVLEEEPRLITCGEVLYIRAGEHHAFEEVHDLVLTNVLYREGDLLRLDRLRAALDRPVGPDGTRQHWQLTDEGLGTVRGLLDRLARESMKEDPLAALMTQSLFMELCVTLCRERFATNGAELPGGARLAHVLAYLRARCCEPIDLEDLARRFGYSARNFARVFREATATSPHDYIVKLRIGNAMRALRTTEATVTDIAFSSGFNDSCHFSYSFGKLVGMSPSEYRRRAHEGARPARPITPANEGPAPERAPRAVS